MTTLEHSQRLLTFFDKKYFLGRNVYINCYNDIVFNDKFNGFDNDWTTKSDEDKTDEEIQKDILMFSQLLQEMALDNYETDSYIFIGYILTITGYESVFKFIQKETKNEVAIRIVLSEDLTTYTWKPVLPTNVEMDNGYTYECYALDEAHPPPREIISVNGKLIMEFYYDNYANLIEFKDTLKEHVIENIKNQIPFYHLLMNGNGSKEDSDSDSDSVSVYSGEDCCIIEWTKELTVLFDTNSTTYNIFKNGVLVSTYNTEGMYVLGDAGTDAFLHDGRLVIFEHGDSKSCIVISEPQQM